MHTHSILYVYAYMCNMQSDFYYYLLVVVLVVIIAIIILAEVEFEKRFSLYIRFCALRNIKSQRYVILMTFVTYFEIRIKYTI